MSTSIGTGAELYAVVDLSKKKDKAEASKCASSPIDNCEVDTALYSVVNKTRKGSSQNNQTDDNDVPVSSAHTEEHAAAVPYSQVKRFKFNHLFLSKAEIFMVSLAMIAFVVITVLFIVLFIKVESSKERCDLSDTKIITSISSCKEATTSGHYTLQSQSCHMTRVYCDMNITCGNTTGGWMRVAELDLYNCPPGFRPEIFDGNKTCIRVDRESECTPVVFNTFNIEYSAVCGNISGYLGENLNNSCDINNCMSPCNQTYFVKFSLISSSSPVWTLAADCCNCILSLEENAFEGLLWDNDDEQPFYKNLSMYMTDDLVMRVCAEGERSHKILALSDMQLYVQ